MSVTTDVEQFILSELSQGRGITAVDPNDNLLAKGIVDSHGVMELVAFLEERYGISVRRRGPHAGELRERRAHRGVRGAQAGRPGLAASGARATTMLMELLYENASARPDDVAIVYRDERVTHGD